MVSTTRLNGVDDFAYYSGRRGMKNMIMYPRILKCIVSCSVLDAFSKPIQIVLYALRALDLRLFAGGKAVIVIKFKRRIEIPPEKQLCWCVVIEMLTWTC
jgi:hypothetical protein